MDFLEWPGFKLLLLIVMIAGVLFLTYSITSVLPWLFWMKESGQAMAIRIIVTIILTLLTILLFREKLSEIYALEEEAILQEFVLHENENIFRFTLFLGVTILFITSIVADLTWPFRIGLILGGSILLLYLIDCLVAVFEGGTEGFTEFLDVFTSHILGILGIAFLLLISTSIFSLTYYGGFSYKKIASTENQSKSLLDRWKESWEEFQETIRKKWEKTEPHPSSSVSEKFSDLRRRFQKLWEQGDLDYIEERLKRMREEKNMQELREFIDMLLKDIQEEKQRKFSPSSETK